MKFNFFRKNNICTQKINLYIANSDIHNKGVFSSAPIKNGEIIEECPLLIFDTKESELLKNSNLYFFYFILDKSPLRVALALGYGSIYNHQAPSNAAFFINKNEDVLIIKAKRNISMNTEITINYNGSPNDLTPISFSSDIL